MRLRRRQLVNRRVWAEFGPLLSGTTEAEVFGQIKVAPDGACLDAEGALWIADEAVKTLLDDIEATFGVARGPRLARQARLGTRS